MLKVFCEGCEKQIPPEQSDGAVVRVYLGNGQYIFYYSADKEGEHDGRHYCRACVVNKLDQEYLPGVVEDIEGDLAGIG